MCVRLCVQYNAEVMVLCCGWQAHMSRPWGADSIQFVRRHLQRQARRATPDPNRGEKPQWIPLAQMKNKAFLQNPMSHAYCLQSGGELPFIPQTHWNGILHAGSVPLRLSQLPLDFDALTSLSSWCANCGGAEHGVYCCEGIPKDPLFPSKGFEPCAFALCKFCGPRHLGEPFRGQMVKIPHAAHAKMKPPIREPIQLYSARASLIIVFTFMESSDLWEMVPKMCLESGLGAPGYAVYVYRWRCSSLEHMEYAVHRMLSPDHFGLLTMWFETVKIVFGGHNDPNAGAQVGSVCADGVIVADASRQFPDDEGCVEKELVQFMIAQAFNRTRCRRAIVVITPRIRRPSRRPRTTRTTIIFLTVRSAVVISLPSRNSIPMLSLTLSALPFLSTRRGRLLVVTRRVSLLQWMCASLVCPSRLGVLLLPLVPRRRRLLLLLVLLL